MIKTANEFDFLQEKAIRSAREMHSRALKEPERKEAVQFKKTLSPLQGLFGDSDTALILGMILLLMSDGGDKMLIMALLYIMS